MVHLLAFGFGAGYAPVAPGTFGTIVGVLFYLAMAGTTPLVYAAALSLAASLALVIAPFALPNVSIGPFILANWLAFIAAGFLALPKFSWRKPFQKPEPEKFKVFRLVLIAFTLAGWIAVSNSKTIG